MEIHSSSLTFIPASHNAKERNDQSTATNNNTEDKASTDSLSSPSYTNTVDKKIDAPTIDLITNNIEQQRKVLSNSRTSSAINAYIQENAQSLKTERSELVSGIDLFA